MSAGEGSHAPPLSSDPEELPPLSLLDALVEVPSVSPEVAELLDADEPSDSVALLDPIPVELVLDVGSPDDPSPLSPPPLLSSAVHASNEAVAPIRNSRRPGQDMRLQ